MTDSTGILQHARWTVPNLQSGYCLDDNARAFVVTLKYHLLAHDSPSLELARRYLAFIQYAQKSDGAFRNFLPYNRHWHEDTGSQDARGRAIQALGFGLRGAPERGMRDAAAYLLERALAHSKPLTSPRAVAFAILGLADACATDWRLKELRERIRQYADYLTDLFERVDDGTWRWFEPYLTYVNSVLPHALLIASELIHDARYKKIAQTSLEFLIGVLFQKDMLDLIGQKGWYHRGGERALFDQQPTDAQHTVELLLTAHRVLGKSRYNDLALRAMEWFYGKNRGGVSLYDQETGGCYDGLTRDGVNRNEGGESTLAHLMARLLIEETKST